MKLSELKTGRDGHRHARCGRCAFRLARHVHRYNRRLPIEVVQNAKKRPILVFERDSLIAIGRKDCDLIDVEERR